MEDLQIDFEKGDGVVPVVTQDHETGDVLMLAYMNAEAWDETLRTGRVCYYSRSRDRLWRKGEESGHFQEVHSIFIDCDRDTILLRVSQHGGAACHLGYRSCFFRRREDGGWEQIAEPVFDPAEVYGKGSSHGR